MQTAGTKQSQIADYRFSGHESFAFRYTWLPKAFAGLKRNRHLFRNEEDAIIRLGVGKNMVRSMRFWVEAAGIAAPLATGGLGPTPLGEFIFGEASADPFLEDIQTLWVIHWNISTHLREPLFAWDFLLNRWHEPELSEQSVLRVFETEARKVSKKDLSPITLKQHFDVFLHTYSPTGGTKGTILEDNLDCPLTELQLLSVVGERDLGGRKREPTYAFRREDKASITPEIFFWALNDFWNKFHPNEKTLPVRSLATGHGSPGQIFKIPEADVLTRLQEIESATKGAFSYQESTALPQVHQNRALGDLSLLKPAFNRRALHA